MDELTTEIKAQTKKRRSKTAVDDASSKDNLPMDVDQVESKKGTRSHPSRPARTRTQRQASDKGTLEQPETHAQKPTRSEAFKILIARANTGNETCIAELKKVLDQSPEIWQHVGDLVNVAKRALLESIARDDVLAQEAVKRHVAELGQQLRGSCPSPLEKLLLDQVVLTYMASCHAEALAAERDLKPGPTATFRLKQAESAQKRHLNAIKSLAKVRSLGHAAMWGEVKA